MIRAGVNFGVGLAAVVMLAAAAGLGTAIKRYNMILVKEPIYPKGGKLLRSLPTETPSWIRLGSDTIEQAEVLESLGTENYLTRSYIERNPKVPGKPVIIGLHAAYYTGSIDSVPHVPDRCFVGGGMQIGEVLGAIPLNLKQDWRWTEKPNPLHPNQKLIEYRTEGGQYVHLPRDPQNISINTMKFLDKGSAPIFSGYFFVANGGHVSLAEQVRLLAFDLNSKYAYYMKVQVTSDKVASGEELAAAASSLIGEMFGEIMQCVPDWVEVEAGKYPPPRDAAPGAVK